jgi:hypothetical protein
MGRDARLARALAADNRGNRARILVARGTYLDRLVRDLRIEAHWQTWVQGRRVWAASAQRADMRRRGMSPAVILRAVEIVDVGNLTPILADMGVPWPWCADALVRAYFPLLLHNAEHPDDRRVMQVTVGIAGLPHGQKPPHDAAEIRRDVDWFYRARNKVPRDPPVELEAEYLSEYLKSAHRSADAHGVVGKGLIRAELLLSATIPDLGGLKP